MRVDQTLPCPSCGRPITYNLQALIAGASFECLNCGAKIKIYASSVNDVKKHYEKFINLKDKSKAQKVDTFAINEFIEIIDK
ncbi:hypothetical protein EGI15_02145 [Chryseobacterium cucumeris]|uniref:Uncharacterized protein n=1 Tax=Chryseobacterium cucumeris TaxID=1813611 RepID=A0ABX9XBJ1_9FLAO|nr:MULTISPECIES: hypothetical protein [Chryseobacterium]MPS66721.1 hypothetical protein [Chryseobacterium sp.]PZU05626.1 MAG: hypothetical protein DI622_18820 [Chryseobacterium sp.]ROH96618.1 hypothetical protein EGI15_02145 [Chryseobacterium cucumeris]GEJ45920.1 hypothetical protein CRS_25280 [Chryseobacterium sp. ON_d1]HCN50389.1 hypothetical protein [Chryseobacterium sp.]